MLQVLKCSSYWTCVKRAPDAPWKDEGCLRKNEMLILLPSMSLRSYSPSHFASIHGGIAHEREQGDFKRRAECLATERAWHAPLPLTTINTRKNIVSNVFGREFVIGFDDIKNGTLTSYHIPSFLSIVGCFRTPCPEMQGSLDRAARPLRIASRRRKHESLNTSVVRYCLFFTSRSFDASTHLEQVALWYSKWYCCI